MGRLSHGKEYRFATGPERVSRRSTWRIPRWRNSWRTTGVDEAQADALMTYGATPERPHGILARHRSRRTRGRPSRIKHLFKPQNHRSEQRPTRTTPSRTPVASLSPEQLRAVFAECTTTSFEGPEVVSGKVNLNTAGPEVLRIIFNGDSAVAESIMAYRQSRAEGITSIVDLLGTASYRSRTYSQRSQTSST